MAVKSTNTRVMVTLTKEQKQWLERVYGSASLGVRAIISEKMSTK